MPRLKPPCDSCGTRRQVKRHKLGAGLYAYWCRKLACEAVARLKGGHLEDYMSSFNDILKATYSAAIERQLTDEEPPPTLMAPTSRRQAPVVELG